MAAYCHTTLARRFARIALLALAVPSVAHADRAAGPHDIFGFLDTDADGRITPIELRGTSAVPLFPTLDGNADGHVTIGEFERNAPGWIHRRGVGEVLPWPGPDGSAHRPFHPIP